MNSVSQTMFPRHPRWSEFIDRLEHGLLETEDQETVDDAWRYFSLEENPFTQACGRDQLHRDSFEVSRKILKDMRLDVEASLGFFETHGGNCDCEVLLNVADSYWAVNSIG